MHKILYTQSVGDRSAQVVITSVTRDDLPDGGTSIFARTIEFLRRQDNQVKIESLVPDSYKAFNQSKALLEKAC